MPELPEVETIVCDLRDRIVGLKIKEIHVYDKRVLTQKSAQFIVSLKQKTIQEISRRAKALIFKLDPTSFLVVHLKMTGQLIYSQNNLREKQNLKETKIVFKLSNGWYLNYNDQRLFGRLLAVKNLSKVTYLNNIGPEPLNGALTISNLFGQLKQRQAPIKTILMNQQVLAGIGNIYASEILFDAKISPKRSCKRLSLKETQSLYESIQRVLQEAIQYRGTSMRNYRDSSGEKGLFINRIKVYNRAGESCVMCASPIQRVVQAGRSTFFCKKCQK